MNAKTTLSKGSWIRLNQRQAARAGIFLLLLLLLLTLPAAVQAQFNYAINNGTVTITGYTGPGGAVDIPGMINGLPVTSLEYWAFYNCTSLTSVTIPDSVTSIGAAAFGLCTSLTNVTIPNSITYLGYQAFDSCTSLASVTIPSSVTILGGDTFENCTRLTSIVVDAFNPVYTSVAGVVFDKSQTTLVVCPAGKAGGYTIPDNVTSIGSQAFQTCASLTSVTIPNSVISIDYAAFSFCTSLASVVIPKSVTSIGVYLFASCYSLTNATIGNGVTSIRTGMFDGCSSLTSVTIPNTVTNIGTDAFYGCTNLTNITIPNSVTDIGTDAFSQCANLTSITIPNNVINIWYDAFNQCCSLTNVTIGDNVTIIWDYAFSRCTSLASVTIPSSVTSIRDNAFSSCSSLTVVYFNGNAPSLGGSSVFSGGNNTIVYHLAGTTGWGTTFGGLPTALWTPENPPTIQTSPQTQMAEAGSAVGLRVNASGSLPLICLWYLNSTNLISCSTNCELDLTNLQLSQSGAYTVVVSNALGAVTSAPALLNVIAAVERRPVPGVKVTGEAGSLWNVDHADSLNPAPLWTPLGSVSLTGTPQYCFDLTLPLPPQRFYRAWQTGTPGVRPSLDLHLVPAITSTGSIGGSVRLDYINQYGPTDAWVTLSTVQLTNTSQLYFDISAPDQPQRLYRLVQMP